MSDLNVKERERFRKLLEVAHSSTFTGEREAALAAATRLAESHGMTLREAAGMADRPSPAEEPQHHRPAGFPGDFGSRTDRAHMRYQRGKSAIYRNDAERLAAEKRRHDEAMAEALRRGLDAEERRLEEKRRNTPLRSSSRGRWRARPEFVRVLLRETSMSAREIAAAAGVTIYDVFREKLLMRQAQQISA